MKKLTQLLIFTALLLAADASAQQKTTETRTPVDSTTTIVISDTQDITPRNNVLLVNPLEFFIFYNLTFLHRLNDNSAMAVGARTPTLARVGGAGINAEYRYYPKGTALKGFYFAPIASINRLTADDESLTATSVGARAGWQWFAGRDFSIGFGLGLDYYVAEDSDDGDLSEYSGTIPALRFNIGYSW